MPTPLPEIPANNFTNNADKAFDSAFNKLQPSVSSLDTASARVRSRLAGTLKGNIQQARDRGLSRGRGVSGLVSQGITDARNENVNNLSNALVDLELGFEDRKIDAGRGLTELGGAQGQLGKGLFDSAVSLRDVDNAFTLGQGELDLGRDRLELDRDELIKTEEEGIRRALNQFFEAFVSGGNAKFTGTNKKVFEEIIGRLFNIVPTEDDSDFDLPLPNAPTTGSPGVSTGAGVNVGGSGSGVGTPISVGTLPGGVG